MRQEAIPVIACGVQLELLWAPFRRQAPVPQSLTVGGRTVPLCLVANRRARRYVLRLRPDGTARVTVPRGGSAKEAYAFAAGHSGWLDKQLRQNAERGTARAWTIGTEVLFRGERVSLRQDDSRLQGRVTLGPLVLPVKLASGDLRPAVERQLQRLARVELTARTLELAALHQAPLKKVMVRNQRSRWGSCSRRGTVSLNWRLIQTPPLVSDYIILHELAHFREMNHSRRFWQEVERLCPNYREAESWLKRHSELLR